MSQMDDYVVVSGLARYLEGLSEERLQAVWLELQDEDAETRRLYRLAARAVELHRLAVAEPANSIAA